MKFFVDTANLEQIKEAAAFGILDGVTTNPSLMAKEGISGQDNVINHYKKICDLVDGDVIQGFDTEILAASVRSPLHIVQAAKSGADVVTCPLSAILGLLKHPLTDIGLAKFLADHAKANS